MLQTDQECSRARASWDGGRGWFADQSSGCTSDTWRVSPCCGCCERGVEDWTRCWMSGHSIYTCQRRTRIMNVVVERSGVAQGARTKANRRVSGDFIIWRWASNSLRLGFKCVLKKEHTGFRHLEENNLENLLVAGMMGGLNTNKIKWFQRVFFRIKL